MSGLGRKMARAKGRRSRAASHTASGRKIQTYHLAAVLFIKVQDGHQVRLQGYPDFRVAPVDTIPSPAEIEEMYWKPILHQVSSTLDPKTHRPPDVYVHPQAIDVAAEHAGFKPPVTSVAIETLLPLLADRDPDVRQVAARALSITWPEVVLSAADIEDLRVQAAAALQDASHRETVAVTRQAMLATLETVLDGRFLEAVN